MLCDDALKVGVDHGPVERPPFADDARDPAFGLFADPRQRRLPLLERQRLQIDAIGNQLAPQKSGLPACGISASAPEGLSRMFSAHMNSYHPFGVATRGRA
jgi:hypothetical protein